MRYIGVCVYINFVIYKYVFKYNKIYLYITKYKYAQIYFI